MRGWIFSFVEEIEGIRACFTWNTAVNIYKILDVSRVSVSANLSRAETSVFLADTCGASGVGVYQLDFDCLAGGCTDRWLWTTLGAST